MEPIILASGSKRRQEFFRLLGLPFTCIPAMIDETPQPGLSPGQAAENIAMQKVMAVAKKLEAEQAKVLQSRVPQWVFGADTIVVLDGSIFGKPVGPDEAREMLGRLSGRRHEVITAMALYNNQKLSCRSVSCEVVFALLSEAEIEWYLDSGEWEGAAGSYRLQGKGACLITEINGSPGAVEGLPLHEFCVMLKDNGYPWIANRRLSAESSIVG
jgi:septum formation protein